MQTKNTAGERGAGSQRRTTPRAEHVGSLVRPPRLLQASAHIDVQQLALTPQCGFGTVPGLQTTTEDVQWRKLELVGRVADQVWPGG